MTDTADTESVGKRRRPDRRLVDEQLAEQLIAQAQEQGVELLGEGGLLQQMTKAVLERALAEELTDHLGYEEGDRAGRGSGNSRNGFTAKRLLTEAGHVDLEVPRDRASTFDPQIVPKGARRRDGVDALVISLYARGMTVRDIQAHLAEIYDVTVSPDLISKITDSVLEEVGEWQSRPLDRVWPVIFLDAVVCRVRDNGTVRNKAAHLAVGVDTDGKEVLIVVWVGLTGLPEAVTAVWPDTVVQTCPVQMYIVHLTRASLRWVNYKCRRKVAAQLRLIYGAPTEQAAETPSTDSQIGRLYPALKRQWEAAWEQITPFFAFPPEVRRSSTPPT